MRRVAPWLVPLLAACAGGEGPNVVLVTLDTTRADRLGAMGDPEARTPALDALAARGTLFERAYASAPLTLPSHTTLLTGLDPNRHGVHDNGRFAAPASLETLAERLAARGYATGAFVSAFVLDAAFGLDQGFQVYDDDTAAGGDPLRFAVPSRRGEEVTDRALAWLAGAGRPFFLWVHYYDVHAPRAPPPPFDALGDPYAGELAYVDAQVGRLLAGVERAARGRETLVIAVGDHGESLGEHGELSHGVLAYDSTLHVPLIAAGPGFPPARSRAWVRTADVAPSVLAAVGEAPGAGLSGRPLQEAAAGTAGDAGYFESFAPQYGMGWARIAGVRRGRWKLTAEPEPLELYDVLEDPRELRNRAAEEPERVARLMDLYASLRPGAPAAEAPAGDSLELREQLAALGYLAGPEPRAAPGRADPRELVGAVAWIDRARGLAVEGRVADAIEALEIFATSPVARFLALRSLAPLYAVAGRADDAVAAYRDLAELTGSLDAQVDLANALVLAGRPGDALEVLAPAAPAGDPAPRLHLVRARALLALGRPAEAAPELAAVRGRDPWNDTALALEGQLRAAQQGPEPAIEELRSRLAQAPEAGRLLETRGVLARLLHASGRDREAVRLLEAGGAPPPEHRAILAEIAAGRGDREAAASLYESALAERPASQALRRELADLYGELGRLDDALRLYGELLAVAPADATLRVDRGATFFAAGRLAEAEADYRRALALDDGLPEAAFNLALVELADGREGQAEGHLLRAVELRPDYAKAHFHLARLYRARGDPRAARHAERAVQASAASEARRGE